MHRRASLLPLLRRWRAWQHQHQHQQHQQQHPICIASTAPPPAHDHQGGHHPHQSTWRAHSAAAAAPPTTRADAVDTVALALERLGVKPGRDCEILGGLMTVDLAVHLPDQKRQVAIDVTPRPPEGGGGDDDDRGATGRPRSPHTPQRAWALAQARRHALKANGWHYVQLPAIEVLAAMGDEEEEEALVRERVLAAGDEGGGHVCGSGCSH